MKASGSRSQLMVAARIMVGASATIAASQGRRRTVSAVAATVTAKAMNSSTTLTSKKTVAGLSVGKTPVTAAVISAAICMRPPVSTGYSRCWPSGIACMYGSRPSAKPRSVYSGAMSV